MPGKPPRDEPQPVVIERHFISLGLCWRYHQIEWAVEIMQFLALSCIKLSFIWFFRRIFAIHKSGVFHWVSRVAIAIVILWTVAMFNSFMCEPWSKSSSKTTVFWIWSSHDSKEAVGPFSVPIRAFWKIGLIGKYIIPSLLIDERDFIGGNAYLGVCQWMRNE